MANASTEDGHTYDVRIDYIVVGAPASTTREEMDIIMAECPTT
jgi:hypothetical protein